MTDPLAADDAILHRGFGDSRDRDIYRAIADKRGRALREAVTTLDDIGSGEIGIHMAVRVAQKVLARIREILEGK